MSVTSLYETLETVLKHCPLFEDKSLKADVIINPTAGGFTRKKIRAAHFIEMNEAILEAEKLPLRKASVETRFHLTERKNHASEICEEIISKACTEDANTMHLIITAGGDGTSLEVLTELMKISPPLLDRFTVLRLPMGTGNDGADGRTLSDAIFRLIKPSFIEKQCAIKVTTASNRGPWYAFNIASIGLDAFVTHMTNRLKTSFPGDSYKLWVDIASIFYDKVYKVSKIKALFYSQGSIIHTINRKILLMAMGVSGNRQYGSNKPILPDNDNVCVVHQMPFIKKLLLKDKITYGHHRGLSEVELINADAVVLEYSAKILIQMDGEAEALAEVDFPVRLEKTIPCIQSIQYLK